MLTIRAAASETEYPLSIPFRDQPDPIRRFPQHSPSLNKTWLAQYATPDRPQPAWNRLDWPMWGLLRYAEMHVLLPGDDWVLLRDAIAADQLVTVSFDDAAGGTGSASLRVVDAQPVVDSRTVPSGNATNSDTVLWHLTLTDERYVYAQRVHDGSGNDLSDWGHLIASLIEQATSQTVSATTIQTDLTAAGSTQYDNPTSVWGNDNVVGQNLAALIDSACAAVNLRVAVALDGTLSVQTHVTAKDALEIVDADLATGGYRRPRERRAETLSLVRYARGGILATDTRSVPDGVAGTLTAWVPHSTDDALDRYAADYRAWTEIDTPDMTLTGYLPPPTSACVDRWILDHDKAVSALWCDGADYPWPLVGGLAVGRDQLLNACYTTDGYGNVTGIRFQWLKPDDTVRCEDLKECPTCPPPPPGTGELRGTVQSDTGANLSGRTLTLSGASSGTTTTDVRGEYIFSGVTDGSNTVTLTLVGPESSTVVVDGGASSAGNAGTVTVAADTHIITFVVTP